jgi:hypothetical protein
MVTVDRSFFKNILYVLICSLVLAIYPALTMASEDVIIASLTGLLLDTINIFLGYIFIEMARGKSMTGFLKYVLGGMSLRLLFLLSSLFFAIKVLRLHLIAFVVSLFLYYVIYLIFEILYIDKKVREKTS